MKSRLALLFLFAFSQAFGEAEYWVSIGSYLNAETAEKVRREAESIMAESVAVVSSVTSQGLMYRVVLGPHINRNLAKDKIINANVAGYLEAWMVSVKPDEFVDYTETYNRDYTFDIAPALEDLPIQELEPTTPRKEIKEPVTEAPAGYKLHKLHREAHGPPQHNPSTGSPAQLQIEVVAGEPVTLLKYPANINFNLDGKLEDPVWSEVASHENFLVLEPDTLAKGIYPTKVQFWYTDRGLYVGFDMKQPKETLVRWLSSRDAGRLNRDNVSLTIDSSGAGRYGYFVNIALGDALTDGTALPERSFKIDWDGAWRGATSETKDGWSAEIFLPWSQITMPKQDGKRKMGIYVSRKVAHLDERWGWPALPPTQSKFLSVLQPVMLDGINPKQQWSLFPYVSVTSDELSKETLYKAGAGFVWKPSVNFQLTTAINPDFGNVEADDVIVNLTAFETFFRERRLFFQQEQDIFQTTPRSNGFGNREPTLLVNTRRIGGRPRAPVVPAGVTIPNTELNQPTELQGAVKLTGQIGSVRYGLLTAFEDETKFDVGTANYHQDGRNFGAARFLYESNAGGAYKAIGWLGTAVTHSEQDAYVQALDYHYLDAEGHWKFDGQLIYTDKDGVGDGNGGFFDLSYQFNPGLKANLSATYYDRTIDFNDLGFFRRNDVATIRAGLEWKRSNLDWAKEVEFSPSVTQEWNNDKEKVRSGVFIGYNFKLNNTHKINGFVGWFPDRFEDRLSFGNGTFRIVDRPSASITYETDTSRRFSVRGELAYEKGLIGGDRNDAGFRITWRPMDRLNLTAGLNYRDRSSWLLHQEDANFTTFDATEWRPKVEFDFFVTAKQHLRIAFQWVGIRAEEQEFFLIPATAGDLIPTAKPAGTTDDFTISQLSFQVRYRWEIAPLSDLFVVYTRNGFANPTSDSFDNLLDTAFSEPDSEQLVVKLRYRLGS